MVGDPDLFGDRKKLGDSINPRPFYPPVVGGHPQPLKGSLNYPKRVTKNCQGYIYYIP